MRIDALARRPAGRLLSPADAIVLVIVTEIVVHATWVILRLTDASRMVVLEFVWTLGTLYGLAAIGKLARQYRVEREAAGSIVAGELPVTHAQEAREKECTPSHHRSPAGAGVGLSNAIAMGDREKKKKRLGSNRPWLSRPHSSTNRRYTQVNAAADGRR